MTAANPAPPAEYWEDFYASGRSRWSGNANHSLVAEVVDLRPGTALDVGCGQGGDAIWLASRGWKVTGADIAASALAVAQEHAAAAGLAGAVTWDRGDLGESLPAGPFDLVAATYLHSPVALDRVRILRSAAAAVAPGGTLLIIGHAPSAAHPHAELTTPQEDLESLALTEGDWRVHTCEQRTFDHAFRDEEPMSRTDGVLRLERLR